MLVLIMLMAMTTKMMMIMMTVFLLIVHKSEWMMLSKCVRCNLCKMN